MIGRRLRLSVATVVSAGAISIATPSRIDGQAPPATGSIFGQVIDAASGQPVPGALVLLDDARPNTVGPTPIEEHAPMPNGAIAPKRAIANGAGQFVFHDLPKSQYRLQAGAPGYIDGTYGQSIVSTPGRLLVLDADEHAANVRIKLWKFGSLSGRVFDDAGEPVVGLTVQSFRASVEGRRQAFVDVGGAATDDRGVYRIGSLPPGRYLVGLPQTVATMPVAVMNAMNDSMRYGGREGGEAIRELQLSDGPRSFVLGMRGVRMGDLEVEMTRAGNVPLAPGSKTTSILAYQTVFFPGATNVADATLVTLASGQEQAGIDLRLRAVPTVRVSGTVVGSSGIAAGLGVHLVDAASPVGIDGYDTAVTATDASGTFTLLGVPPGQYAVRAYRLSPQMKGPDAPPTLDESLFANATLAVGDRDVDNVNLTLRLGARVRGRIVFQGTGTPPAFKQTQIAAVDATTGRQSLSQFADSDGTFATRRLPPGKYSVVGLNFPTWVFLSATIGGRDIDGAPIDLQYSDVGEVVVTYTNQPTRISGMIHTSEGSAVGPSDRDVLIVAFPANHQAWIESGMAKRRLQIQPPEKNGAFTIIGLPPGDYLIAAVPAEAGGDSHSAAFFDALARTGSRVTLTTGQTASIDLTVKSVR